MKKKNVIPYNELDVHVRKNLPEFFNGFKFKPGDVLQGNIEFTGRSWLNTTYIVCNCHRDSLNKRRYYTVIEHYPFGKLQNKLIKFIEEFKFEFLIRNEIVVDYIPKHQIWSLIQEQINVPYQQGYTNFTLIDESSESIEINNEYLSMGHLQKVLKEYKISSKNFSPIVVFKAPCIKCDADFYSIDYKNRNIGKDLTNFKLIGFVYDPNKKLTNTGIISNIMSNYCESYYETFNQKFELPFEHWKIDYQIRMNYLVGGVVDDLGENPSRWIIALFQNINYDLFISTFGQHFSNSESEYLIRANSLKQVNYYNKYVYTL